MKEKLKEFFHQDAVQYWGKFILKTVFYLIILLVLVYFYHFSHLDGGNFIYNEF